MADSRTIYLNGANGTNAPNGSITPGTPHGFDFGDLKPAPARHTPEPSVASPVPSASENITNGNVYSNDSNSGNNVNNGGNSNGANNANNANNVKLTPGVADFFSPDVFQIVLHNPTTAHQLLKYSQARFCGENMEFLERVDRYNTLLDELTKTIAEIHKTFTVQDAPRQLQLPNAMMKQMNTDIKMTSLTTLPAMELMFADAQERIEHLLSDDIYPRFVKHQMTTSATRALAEGRGKYAGLGDCFCLTNPNIADNPILFASDGFVKVTGYSRTEIIPRNCRFLQGTHTDRSAVRRLKQAIGSHQESVELLLNYRKTGEPFWNLLYVTPLLDGNGRTAFFLGGQINCSTTIHSCSDVLRLLSAGEDSELVDEPSLNANPVTKSSGGLGALFKGLRSRNSERNGGTSDQPQREAGMEQHLIGKIERMNFREQMESFYTAYSKYLVLAYDDLIVAFFSSGVLDMLCLDPKENLHFVGNNVFKVLGPHAASMPRDYKSRVKSSLKSGRAVSAELNLVTKRSVIYRRSERFATHWTPLKDEMGNVKWVVTTLASVD